MAINFTDFSRIPTQESPLKNAFENIFQGYQMGQMPRQLAEESKQRQLLNQIRELEAQHKPTEFKLNDEAKSLANAIQSKALEYLPRQRALEEEYKRALINKANQNANPIAVAGAKKEQELDIKRTKEIEALAKQLKHTAEDVAGIQGLLKDDKSPTGVIQSLKNKAGFGSEEIGQFNEKALRLQADLARLISSRGGAVAAGLAAQGKPSSWRSHSYNVGITTSMQDRIEREFKDLQDEYRRISNGRELPYSLEDIFDKATNQAVHLTSAPQIPSWVKNSNQFKEWKNSLPRDQQEALRKAHLGG